MRIGLVLVIVGSVGFTAACASGDDDDDGMPAAIDCTTDKTTYPDVSMFDKCQMCHSSALMGGSARHSAPANINFDTAELASVAAKSAQPEVKAGVMPPPNSGITVTEAEKQKFYAWVECGLKP